MMRARAQQSESSLQAQITSLLANTDLAALDSLAELVADYIAAKAKDKSVPVSPSRSRPFLLVAF